MPFAFFVTVAALVLAGCGNTYHPEYHPVSVSSVSQHIEYPVNVQSGPAGAPPVVIRRELPPSP